MAHKIKALAVSIGATLVFASFASHAQTTLLKQDPQAGDPLSRLNFTVSGSIRPQFNMMSGDGDKGSYKRNGFDGGTRFRFAADYYLFDDISWISYYELGVNIPALFDWDNHYAEGANNTTRRMLYTGLKSDTVLHGPGPVGLGGGLLEALHLRCRDIAGEPHQAVPRRARQQKRRRRAFPFRPQRQ